MNKQFLNYFNEYIKSFNAHPVLEEALIYSFNSNGKLIRPYLFFAMLEDLNIKETYLEIAIAIEMIHTYSLVHDDLPAIDDDDYRRGKLTCHKAFGEDVAILVGDSLLTHAFDLITKSELSPEIKINIIKEFTYASGIGGMIGGQILDVKNECNPNLSLIELQTIHDKKTAMMIELPIKCAMLISTSIHEDALNASRDLGLLYQIQDDYLDSYGDFEKIGKKINADANKTTYTSLLPKEELEATISKLGKQILNEYNQFPKTQSLIEKIIKREG